MKFLACGAPTPWGGPIIPLKRVAYRSGGKFRGFWGPGGAYPDLSGLLREHCSAVSRPRPGGTPDVPKFTPIYISARLRSVNALFSAPHAEYAVRK